MGIFNKIEKVKNFVGEDWANLKVKPYNYINPADRGLRFNIQCEVKDADLSINKIYLNVKALEKVSIQNVQLAQQKEVEIGTRKEAFSSSHQTFCEKFKILEPQVLKAKQTYQWDIEISLPQEINGTYHGYNAHHEWKAYAGLDIEGEDPVSEWITFEVRK